MAISKIVQDSLNGGVAGSGPAFSAWSSTNQGLSGTTETKVTFNNEQFDTANCFSSSRFTPNVAGYYQVSAAIAFTAAVSGYCSIYLWKNGARFCQMAEFQMTTSSYQGFPATFLVYLNGTTDYIELYTTTQNGGTIYGDATYPYTYFQAVMVRGA